MGGEAVNPGRFLYCAIGNSKHRSTLRELCRFAEKAGNDVEVLAVVEPASRWDRLAHPEYVDRVQNEDVEGWKRAFVRWKRDLPQIVDCSVEVGSLAKSVVEAIGTSEPEALVLAAPESRHDIAMTQRLMRISPCPVWILRPTRAKHLRILAAVNPEPDELDLNLAIMAGATRMADELDAELYLFSAWELYGEQTMRRSAFIHTTVEEFDDMYSLREEVTRRGVNELAEMTPDPGRWNQLVSNGMAAPEILDAVRSNRINMLVMGTIGRSGLNGILMGNTAEEVAETVRCSLYSVRVTEKK